MANAPPLPFPSRDLDQLAQEEQALALPRFTADDAWEIGSGLRTALRSGSSSPAVVNITLANSNQLLFHTTSRSGTAPDNDTWVARKRATVLRFGHSTWWMHNKLNGDEAFFREKFMLGDTAGQYAIHGGGFPVFVQGVEGVVAVIVVSGLKQEQDHQIIVEFLKQYQKVAAGEKPVAA